MFIAACVQMRCTTKEKDNWVQLEELCLRAATNGASLIVTPENSTFLGPQFHKVERAESLQGETVQRLSALAKQCDAHLLIGSIAEQRLLADGSIDKEHCYNTSLLFSPRGELLGFYRKIHLFDVDVSGGLSIRESDTITPGDDIVVVDTELGKIGLSICYDLRFPELYRKLVDKGADIIAIPSAFTLTTGKDHWHALLRARAIETQTYVLAPGQWGTHDLEGKRKSYGHSVIIDPWGVVVADRGEGIGICYAEIDLDYMHQVRNSIPVRNHRRV
jgi:deaminated glutathione amidase